MKIQKDELIRALAIVKPGLANNTNISQSTAFAFLGDKVVTYNDSISISHPVSGLNIKGAIQADILYNFLGKLKKSEIDIETTETAVVLTCGRAKAEISLQSEITLPIEDELGEKGKWKKLPDGFLEFVEFAAGACGKSQKRPILTAINITQEGRIEGSDSFKIAACQLSENMPLPTFLLPVTSATPLIRLKPVKISKGNGWVHFENKAGTVFSSRLFDDQYPNIAQFLETEGITVTFPKSLLTALDRASVFAKRETEVQESVFITFKNNKLTLAADCDDGKFTETLNVKFEDEPFTFEIAPYLLRYILKQTLECVVSEERLKFEGEGWQYISVLKSMTE